MRYKHLWYLSYLNKAFRTKNDILDGAEILEDQGFVFASLELVRPPDQNDYFIGHRITATEEVERVYEEAEVPDESLPLIDQFGPVFASFQAFLPIIVPFVNDSAINFPRNPALGTSFRMNGEKYNEIAFVMTKYENEFYLFEELSKILLQVAKEYYRRYHPAYAWFDFSPSFDRLALEPILKHKFRELYWVNFFGPEYVAKYGKGFFLDAPVWKTEELEDGGIMLQLSPQITAADHNVDVKAISTYFYPVGVRYIAWPKNIRFTGSGRLAKEREDLNY